MVSQINLKCSLAPVTSSGHGSKHECPARLGSAAEKARRTQPKGTRSRASARRPPQQQSPPQTQSFALHHRAFRAAAHSFSQQGYGTINLNGGTLQPFSLPEVNVKVSSTTAQLQCSGFSTLILGACCTLDLESATAQGGQRVVTALLEERCGKDQLICPQSLQQCPPLGSQQRSPSQLWSTQEILEQRQVCFGWPWCCCCFKTGVHLRVTIKRQYSC